MSEYLATRQPDLVNEQEWDEMLGRFAPASRSYLRRLLRESGVPLAPLVEGVRQDSLEGLERTLMAMERVYSQARSKGDTACQMACRRAVIEAKDHARWSLRRSSATDEEKAMKQEMIEWMQVWLQDPTIFKSWMKLRKRVNRESCQ